VSRRRCGPQTQFEEVAASRIDRVNHPRSALQPRIMEQPLPRRVGRALTSLADESFEDTLKDVYFAENEILKALPKMAKKATSEDLQQAFTDHAEETKGQVKRLEQIFKLLGEKTEGKECHALKGLVKEADELMGEAKSGPVLDAGLIPCAQAVEHHEMAR
jgi:ferritin-like metal-binding protein YciE